jgi:enoyl-CoA hydratase/carnithine racemase
MRQMYEGEIDKAEVQQLQVRFFRTQMGMPAPTIAVVNGPAVGQGCTFALSCDVVYASSRASFALGDSRRTTRRVPDRASAE